jgi:hypothetical protein
VTAARRPLLFLPWKAEKGTMGSASWNRRLARLRSFLAPLLLACAAAPSLALAQQGVYLYPVRTETKTYTVAVIDKRMWTNPVPEHSEIAVHLQELAHDWVIAQYRKHYEGAVKPGFLDELWRREHPRDNPMSTVVVFEDGDPEKIVGTLSFDHGKDGKLSLERALGWRAPRDEPAFTRRFRGLRAGRAKLSQGVTGAAVELKKFAMTENVHPILHWFAESFHLSRSPDGILMPPEVLATVKPGQRRTRIDHYSHGRVFYERWTESRRFQHLPSRYYLHCHPRMEKYYRRLGFHRLRKQPPGASDTVMWMSRREYARIWEDHLKARKLSSLIPDMRGQMDMTYTWDFLHRIQQLRKGRCLSDAIRAAADSLGETRWYPSPRNPARR